MLSGLNTVYCSGQEKVPVVFQNYECSALHRNKDTAMEWK